MSLDERWAEVFLMYGPMTSHMFKVWTLSTADARAFQRKWNAHVDATQPKRYIDDVQDGDYYGVALAVRDLGRKTSDMQQLMVVLLREAVELLHMIAWVDLELWREVFIDVFSLKDRWKRHAVPVWSFLPYDPLARNVDAANSDVSRFFAGLQQSPRSPFYDPAKKLMLEILGIANDPRNQRLLPAEMEVILLLTPEISEFVPSDKVGIHLRATEESLREMVRCTPRESILPIYVRSTLVTVTADEDVVDSECLADLAALSAVTSIDYLEIHLKPRRKTKACTRGRPPGSSSCWRRSPPLRRGLLGHPRLSGHWIVQDPSSISKLAEPCVAALAGVELAVELNVKEITDADVEILGAVLVGGNPCSPVGPPVRWVTTVTSAVVTFPDGDFQATTMVGECTHLAVVGESPNARELRVHVPGFGVGHTDRDAVVPLAVDPVRSRVTSLILSANGKETGASGVLTLVALLGSGLTSLRIVLYELELQQQHIAAILESCPRLNHLNVSGSALRDLNFVADFCSRPTSTLTELILNDVRLTTWTGAGTFVAALSTPSSRLAHQMKEVAVGFTVNASVDASVVEAVFNMLEQNRRLKNFQVRFPDHLRPSKRLATLQQQPRSKTYYRSMALMWELLDLDHDRAMRLPRTLEMMLGLMPPTSPDIEFVSREQLSRHLCAMAKALSALATCSRSAWMLPIHVVSTNVTLYDTEVDAQSLRDHAVLSAVTAIGSLQIHLEPTGNGYDSWTAFGKLLQHVMLDGGSLDRRIIGVELAYGNLGRFVALCSAVRASRCVRSFNVEAEATSWPQVVWLRWLAWSWLGDGSNDKAALSVTLTIEQVTNDDVDVLSAVLTGGENPCSPFAPPLRRVTTTAAVAATGINNDARATITNPEGTRLTVVGDAPSSRQWIALVPGFGVVYIDHDAATASTHRWQPTDGSHMQSRVTALNLFVTGEQPASLSGAVALVELLGERLTDLQLVMEQQELTQDHVVQILQSCPQLRKVRISGIALSDLDVVIPFLNRPTAELSQFVLIKLRMTQPSALDGFVAALSTPSTHLAQQLADVGLGLTESAAVDSSAVDSLYRMLERNCRLKILTVQFPEVIRPSTPRADPPSHDKCIARSARMVPLRQKLALLSVLNTRGGFLPQDRAALMEVLAFAAEPARRRVSVTFSNW